MSISSVPQIQITNKNIESCCNLMYIIYGYASKCVGNAPQYITNAGSMQNAFKRIFHVIYKISTQKIHCLPFTCVLNMSCCLDNRSARSLCCFNSLLVLLYAYNKNMRRQIDTTNKIGLKIPEPKPLLPINDAIIQL